MRLEGKLAVVTGAGRGIGAGIALRLAEEGAAVVCADINIEQAEATAQACGSNAIARQVQVASSADCDSLIADAVDQLGRLDVVVNNAGINRDAMLHKLTDQQWMEVLDVDLSGVFYMTRAAARTMRDGRLGGSIINISSASWMGNIGQANYAAAKAGVIGLTKTASKELARHRITVNAVCPGFIDTEMTRAIPAPIHEQQLRKIPIGRAGTPADVAALVAFLASDDAAYITGEVINVGGGYSI